MAEATPTNGTAATPADTTFETVALNGGGKKTAAGAEIFKPLLCVVDFHHARGPEVERWFGQPEGTDPAVDNDWSLLPFMALSDGAHASTEDFSYFTLLRPATAAGATATSLFGISCTRQMDASQLLNRPSDVTRSTVQKAVVVIADSPQSFGMLRERLSVVTSAWFAQREFTDVEILRRFQESLADDKERDALSGEEEDRDQYLGMSLRELVREFRWQTLLLLKCCLLQPKMLFFGSRCERLCMMQFSLISLIPGLLRNLQDCAGPELNGYEKKLSKPTNLRTSDRGSLLAYMGLPLQIFGKGSLFGPYTPLQQLDILADYGTKSYIVGSTNSLLLQQRDRYSDIIINLDDNSINISSPSLRTALQLSTADRRWIDFITQEVNDTWDEANPGRPKTMGYVGSEEFIRLQFEDYLLSLISSVKYHEHLAKHGNNPRMLLPDIEGDPSADFNPEFVDYWGRTENHRLWALNTEAHIFDVVAPKHPCAGGLTIDDVQRRIAQQVQDLHLDERFAVGREVMGRNLQAGREKASSMFNKFYADIDALRVAQREKAAEKARQDRSANGSPHDPNRASMPATSPNTAAFPAVDLSKAQQTMQSVGAKAGAYMGSWAAWAGEKRKTGWGKSAASTTSSQSSAGTGGGWGLGGNKSKNRLTMSSTLSDASATEKDSRQSTSGVLSPRMSMSSNTTGTGVAVASAGTENERPGATAAEKRPTTQSSFSESILDGAGSEISSAPRSPVSPRKGDRPLSGGAGARVQGMDGVVEEAASPKRNGEAGAAAAETSPEKKDSPEKQDTKPEEEDKKAAGGEAGDEKSEAEAVGSKVMLRP